MLSRTLQNRLSQCTQGILAFALVLVMGLPALGQRPQGWDASHWDGDLDLSQWQEAYAGGFVFCYTKSTDGTWYIDPTMAPNMTRGKQAGLYMGVFHFCHPQTYSANAEADYFVAHAGEYMTTGWLRPCLDLEDPNAQSLGSGAISNWVNAFFNRVEAQTGAECILYTSTDWAQHYLNSTVANRDLWIAQYLYNPDPQHGTPSIGIFPTWKFWQWTDAGYVPGFGLKDADVFNGTMLQLYGFVIGGGAEPPSVLDQPASMSVPTGGTATFIISAGGTDPLSYQWQKNGVNITNGGHYSGCGTTTLQVSNVDSNDVADYACLVTNSYGNATSNAAVLTIGAAPTTYIVESRSGGQNFYTQYSETGTWYDSSGKSTATGCTANIGHRYCTIGGANTATYKFRPVVSATYEIFTTNLNTYNSGQPLVHKIAHSGGTANVSVCQNQPCNPDPIHTWYSLGQYTLVAGTEYTVIQDASTAAGSGPTNNAGRADAIKWERQGTSSQPPTITQDPSNQAVAPGGTGTFTVAAAGDPTLTYQWQKNSTNITNGGHYSGCTTITLTISNADINDAGNYRCVVTNPYGSAISNAAALTVSSCTPGTLLNGDFEGGSTSGVAASWIGYQRALNPTTTWSIQTAALPGGGLQYQQIVNTSSTGGGGIRQDITGCTIGATYTISGWMRTNSTSATCAVKCSPTASADWATAIDLNPAQTTSSSSWVAFSGTATATGTSMTIWLDGHTGGTSLDKAVCFDSVAVAVTNCGTPAAPTITQQPSNQSTAAGGTASFTVAATGDGTLTYQWQKNGVNVTNGGHYSGATSATFTIAGADSNDEAGYSCAVTNAYGSTISDTATLTIIPCSTPTLLNGSFEGSNTGGVAASWTGYQRAPNPTTAWTIQTASPPTGGGSQYQQIANTSATGGGGVRQDITGCTIGATYTISGWMRTNSTSATCTVKCSPAASTDWSTAIDLNPAQTTTSASWVAFSGTVTATGTSMTIWLDGHTGGSGLNKAACFDGVTVSGCTAPAGPTISQQPAVQSVCPGGTASFTVGATGTGTLTYQWQKNDSNVTNGGHYAGCTTTTLTISSAAAADAANYRCVVTDSNGSANSDEASLTLKTATGISQHPSNATITQGQTATFTVAGTGEGALSYQWQKNSVNVTNGGHYAGCTTITLTVSSADSNDATNYRCVVTGGCGAATSNAATLTVNTPTQPGDFDQDADVDLEDFGVLQRCYGVTDLTQQPACGPADLNADSAINDSDVTLFLGCESGSNVPANMSCLPGQ